MPEQLSANLVQFILTKEKIILKPILPQSTIERVGFDLLLVAQYSQCLLGPRPVKDGFLQHPQILPGDFVLTVNEVSLCQTLHSAAALVIVGYRLHRLKGKALGCVHQTKKEIYLALKQGGGIISFKCRQ